MKPAMAKSQPAKGKSPKVLQRPSSLKKVWHETKSHGLVKVTAATDKAYITFKASDGKERSLVNVAVAKGPRQARIMACLLEKLQTEEVDKQALVEYKNSLLAQEEEPAKAEDEPEPAKAKGEAKS